MNGIIELTVEEMETQLRAEGELKLTEMTYSECVLARLLVGKELETFAIARKGKLACDAIKNLHREYFTFKSELSPIAAEILFEPAKELE